MKLKKNIKFLLILSTILLFGKSVIADEVKINKYKIELDPKYKLFWFYLLDNCDHAGVFDADIESALNALL